MSYLGSFSCSWSIGGILTAVLLAGCGGGGGGGGGGAAPAVPPPGKAVGGTGNDYGFSVTQTLDGGYVIAGATNSKGAGGYDAYLIKTNASGNVEHETTFGSTGNDIAYDVQRTIDGAYIITGVYGVLNTSPDPSIPADLVGELFVRKVDTNFNLLWETKYSDNISAQNGCRYALGYSLQQTRDDGFIVAGSCAFNIGGEYPYVLKLDSAGNRLWEFNNLLGISSAGNVNSIKQTIDDGYIVAIATHIVKLDASGTVVWTQETDGASAPVGGSAQSICEASDAGLIFTGIGNFVAGTSPGDLYLAKYSADGTLLTWEKTFGSTGGDEGLSVQVTTDNGIISVGRGSMNEGRLFDVYLLKTDAGGNQQWSKSFGGTADDVGRAVRQTSDGGYIVVGYTKSKGAGNNDIYLIKTDANGNSLW